VDAERHVPAVLLGHADWHECDRAAGTRSWNSGQLSSAMKTVSLI
jgi:hypothetical protein